MKKVFLFLMLCLLVTDYSFAESDNHSFIPEKGFVPNAETAINIAEAVWLPIYGTSIYQRKPFSAKLENDVWIVKGSLPKNLLGGVPIAEISKSNGEILRVSYGK